MSHFTTEAVPRAHARPLPIILEHRGEPSPRCQPRRSHRLVIPDAAELTGRFRRSQQNGMGELFSASIPKCIAFESSPVAAWSLPISLRDIASRET